METLFPALIAFTLAGPALAEARLTDTRFEAFALDSTRAAPRRIRDGDRVVHRVGTSCYSWQLSFAPTDGPVELKETLTLPSAAPHWGSSANTAVAPNRRSAVTLVNGDGATGEASNSWCVAKGDPQGLYRFDIRHGEDLVGSVRFYVKKNR